MKVIKKLLSSPEIWPLFLLALIVCFSTNYTGLQIKSLLFLIFTSITTEYIITKIFKTDLNFNIKNISFAFIVFLITRTAPGFFLAVFTLIFAHLLEHIAKYKERSVFNNISLSLFIFSLFGLTINWWGVNVSTFINFITVILGLIIAYLKEELKIIFLFLITNIGLNLVFTVNPLYSIKQVFVPGFLFFTLFLLTKKSNIFTQSPRLKYIYVIIVSSLSIIIPKFGFFTDPLISSLVMTDFAFFSFDLLLPRKT